MNEEPFTGIELEQRNEEIDELRVFCIILNRKTNKWRLTQSDSVFCKDKLNETDFTTILKTLKQEYIRVTGKRIRFNCKR